MAGDYVPRGDDFCMAVSLGLPQLRPYTRQFQSTLNAVVRLHHKDPAQPRRNLSAQSHRLADNKVTRFICLHSQNIIETEVRRQRLYSTARVSED